MYFKSKNLIIIILLIVCGILGGGLAWTQLISSVPAEIQKSILSPEQAGNLALAYVNDVLLGGQIEAKIVSEIKEEKGLYKFQIDVQGEKIDSYITKDGKIFFPQGIDLTKEQAETETESETVEGNFLVSGDEICRENGKPIVYFFGSKGCPYCLWEHPIIEEVALRFGDEISFHNNMDNQEDTEVFSKYSPGYVPLLVLGCQYYRVGSGERLGAEKEKEALTSLICQLTANQPATVCQ